MFDKPEIYRRPMQQIRASRLWIMDWATRQVREYKDGFPLKVQAAIREVPDPGPFRVTADGLAFVALYDVPALPREWISLAIFGQDYENEHRPWFATPKVDLHIDPKEWRTSPSAMDGSHFYLGAGGGAPAGMLIPLADRWKEAPQ